MSGLYASIRQRMLKGAFDWENTTVKLYAFTDPLYEFNPAHITLASVGVPAAVSTTLSGKVATSTGFARSDPAVLLSVPIGDPILFLILAESIPVSPLLIAYIDVGEGLPYEPNGLDQVVIPDWIDYRGWFSP